MPRPIYFIKPPLGADEMGEVQAQLEQSGRTLDYVPDEDTYFQIAAAKMVLNKGPSVVIGGASKMEEAVLPDGVPRSTLADTLRYMLTQMKPTQELLIIDPFLFPPDLQQHPDPSYLPYLEMILGPTLAAIDQLRIVTKANRHQATENAFVAMAQGKKGALVITQKYTDAFHDRFWIGDGGRGLFIGTSLNGIGKRYSLTDYLKDDDAADIYGRYNALL
jgi:hypothetical protein